MCSKPRSSTKVLIDVVDVVERDNPAIHNKAPPSDEDESVRSGVRHLLALSLQGNNWRLFLVASLSLGLSSAGGVAVPAVLGQLLDSAVMPAPALNTSSTSSTSSDGSDGSDGSAMQPLGRSLALLALAAVAHSVGFKID